MQARLNFTIERGDGRSEQMDFVVDELVIAGWTGRDPVAVEKHIAELEALGVKRPATTPIFYRVAAARLTNASRIEVTGGASSGEVEFVLFARGGELFLGVGSDHTDREAETYGVTLSKQMCDKPVAPVVWPLAEALGHWDQLVLRSHIVENGARTLYQEGQVSGMLAPQTLIETYAGKAGLRDGAAMFCGTFAARGGIRASSRFEFEIEDPVRGRKIAHGYDMINLPVLG